MKKTSVKLIASILAPGLIAASGALNAATINFTYTLNTDAVLNDPGDLGTLDTRTGNEGIDTTGVFLTASAANNFANGTGLPDSGIFAAAVNGDHPEVQLRYSNEDNGFNSRRIVPNDSVFTITTAADNYDDIYVFALSGGGDAGSRFTLNYTTGAPDVYEFTVDDWFDDGGQLSIMPTGVTFFYLIDGLDRFVTNTFQNPNDTAIFGYKLNSDSARTLTSIDIDRTDTNTSRYLNIMGVSGVTVAIPEPSGTALTTLAALGLFLRRRR